MNQTNRRINRQKKSLKILLIMLVITLLMAAFTIYRDYQSRPGFLERIWISERGADYITIAWDRPRNVYRYAITYNNKSIYVSGMRSEMRLTGLDENTEYTISVRADSKEREGFDTLTEKASTKKRQSIIGQNNYMKFANTLVDLKLSSETELTYTSNNKAMKIMGDKIMFIRPGKYIVTAQAQETDDYTSSSKKVSVQVLDSVSLDIDKATPHIFYKLHNKNCELIMNIIGVKEASVPQSFEYKDGEYVVLYVNPGDKSQRIIKFGEKKEVFKPKTDFGHCNGLTFGNGKFFMVKGGGTTMISFDSPNDNYESLRLHYDTSGIAYDDKANLFYTSQYQGLTSYDKDFNEVNRFKRIHRSYRHYPQDSGAYGGIMMHCVSGENYLGTNYIDFYDMLHKKYMGTIECNLKEVESLIVDDEGYIQLLCNTEKPEDCIWKTPINMKMLVE